MDPLQFYLLSTIGRSNARGRKYARSTILHTVIRLKFPFEWLEFRFSVWKVHFYICTN